MTSRKTKVCRITEAWFDDCFYFCYKYDKIESEQSVWKKKHKLLKLQIEMFCLHAFYFLIKYLKWDVYVRGGGVKLTSAEIQHAISYHTVLLVRSCYFDYIFSMLSWYFPKDLKHLKTSICCGAQMNVSTLVSLLWISVMLRPTHAEGELEDVHILYFESRFILFFFVHPSSIS